MCSGTFTFLALKQWGYYARTFMMWSLKHLWPRALKHLRITRWNIVTQCAGTPELEHWQIVIWNIHDRDWFIFCLRCSSAVYRCFNVKIHGEPWMYGLAQVWASVFQRRSSVFQHRFHDVSAQVTPCDGFVRRENRLTLFSVQSIPTEFDCKHYKGGKRLL